MLFVVIWFRLSLVKSPATTLLAYDSLQEKWYYDHTTCLRSRKVSPILGMGNKLYFLLFKRLRRTNLIPGAKSWFDRLETIFRSDRPFWKEKMEQRKRNAVELTTSGMSVLGFWFCALVTQTKPRHGVAYIFNCKPITQRDCDKIKNFLIFSPFYACNTVER